MSNIRQQISLEAEIRTLKAENKELKLKEGNFAGLTNFSNIQCELILELVEETKSLKAHCLAKDTTEDKN